jgi:hypothetical protein
MVSKSTKPWQFDGPRAFQADPSWYEAYWYREPAPRRPSPFSRSISILVHALQKLTLLLGQFAKPIRTRAMRASRVKQGQWWHTVRP